jgi:hypothetical protein
VTYQPLLISLDHFPCGSFGTTILSQYRIHSRRIHETTLTISPCCQWTNTPWPKVSLLSYLSLTEWPSSEPLNSPSPSVPQNVWETLLIGRQSHFRNFSFFIIYEASSTEKSYLSGSSNFSALGNSLTAEILYPRCRPILFPLERYHSPWPYICAEVIFY